MSKQFAIVGSGCIDIFATSNSPIVTHDSNIGAVKIGYGGVGRNIAENLAHLQQSVVLIAAFSDDPLSKQMLAHAAEAGIDTKNCFIAHNQKAPYYISVNEANGDMMVAVNDMEINNIITPTFLKEKLPLLNACDAVIVDTNITAESIAFLAQSLSVPLFADAVSTKKAQKLTAILPYLSALNCNLLEAEALLGIEINADIQSLSIAGDQFHNLGIKHVLITLGAKGAFYSNQTTQILRNALHSKIKNTNGCGDAFSAAAFWGILENHEPSVLLQNALTAAAITAQSDASVTPELSLHALQTKQ